MRSLTLCELKVLIVDKIKNIKRLYSEIPEDVVDFFDNAMSIDYVRSLAKELFDYCNEYDLVKEKRDDKNSNT